MNIEIRVVDLPATTIKTLSFGTTGCVVAKTKLDKKYSMFDGLRKMYCKALAVGNCSTNKNVPGSSRVTNENKLISSSKKFKAGRDDFKKCRICKHMTHHISAHYCQSCAFQKGICPFCGRKVLETMNYRNSGV
uniref:Cysteine-rich PDZ-binding protein n=1 Tax=Ditylenchus dipsaci TaxID=166011 RepID=A0A915DPF1_9BILA